MSPSSRPISSAAQGRAGQRAGAGGQPAEQGFFQQELQRHRRSPALFLYPVVIVSLSGVQGSLKWVDNFGIQILIYVMLAWGLNIVVGLAGLLDLGYVAFYAVGAYSYALLGTHFGLSFWILLPAAGIMAAFWGVILGFPVLRLRGDYLAIVTLAFGEIIRLVLINWREVTNGTAGISGIPKVTFFGLLSFDVSSPTTISPRCFGLADVGRLLQDLPLLPHPAALPAHRLRHHPAAAHAGRPRLGSAARGRDRLPLARHQHHQHQAHRLCHRRHVRRLRRLVLRRAPGLRQRRNPSSSWNRRSSWPSSCSAAWARSTGIAIAAVVMIGGTEILREMDFLKMVFGPDFTPELYRMLLFGLAMVVVMVWKPRGFVGSREPTAFLHRTKGGLRRLHQGRARLMSCRRAIHERCRSSRSSTCR